MYEGRMKTNPLASISQLTDADLLSRVKSLVSRERTATAWLVAHLAEVDERRLYLGEGCSSLFTYCLQVLHFSEPETNLRITAARAARRFPEIIEQLADGRLHLSAVGKLAKHLTVENHDELLGAAEHKTRKEVEKLVAAVDPQPDVPSTVRKLPTPSAPAESHLVQKRLAPAIVAPLAPERYRIQFTASAETQDKLRRVQDLLKDKDPAVIFDRALTMLLDSLEKTKFAKTARPRKSPGTKANSRRGSAAVRREVWKRDGGQCTFVAPDGRRCTERGNLHFAHATAYALGGAPTAVNLRLRCAAHNAHEADLDFGPGTSLIRRNRKRPP